MITPDSPSLSLELATPQMGGTPSDESWPKRTPERLRIGKPALALINNAQTPYRVHLHNRIAAELTEVELWSLFTHDVSNAPWQIESSEQIRPVFFGRGELSSNQSKLGGQIREWRKGRAIMRWIQEHDVRAVLLSGYNDLGRFHLLSACRRAGVPCFLFGDSNILADNAGGLKKVVKTAIVRRAVQLATEVCYCGELGREYFAKYGAEAMFPFPYEPDYDSIRQLHPSELMDVRNRFHLNPGRRLLIYSGRLAPEKRVDLLLKAFDQIADVRQEWDLLIVGDGTLRQALSETVSASRRTRIIWTGFLQDPRLIAKLYRCGDVLVLPSDYEPWGVVVTEAATCLALVCSSAVGAARDLVRDGVNGRVFERGSLESLTDALLTVTDEPNLRRMKANSPRVLLDWRAKSDPVAQLKKALVRARVLPC